LNYASDPDGNNTGIETNRPSCIAARLCGRTASQGLLPLRLMPANRHKLSAFAPTPLEVEVAELSSSTFYVGRPFSQPSLSYPTAKLGPRAEAHLSCIAARQLRTHGEKGCFSPALMPAHGISRAQCADAARGWSQENLAVLFRARILEAESSCYPTEISECR